eukprot:455735_1
MDWNNKCEHQNINGNLYSIIANWTAQLNGISINEDITNIILEYNKCRTMPLSIKHISVTRKLPMNNHWPSRAQYFREYYGNDEKVTANSTSSIQECELLKNVIQFYKRNNNNGDECSTKKNDFIRVSFEPQAYDGSKLIINMNTNVPLFENKYVDKIKCIQVNVEKVITKAI